MIKKLTVLEKKKAWVSDFYKIPDLMKELKNTIQPNGVMFCPFHDNHVTPSAKYYANSNKIWCFSEQKMFTAYDVLKELFHWSDERIFEKVPESITSMEFSEEEKTIPIIKTHFKDLTTIMTLSEYLQNLNTVFIHRKEYKQESF